MPITQLYYEQQVSDDNSFYKATISGLALQKGVREITGVLNSPIPLAAANEFSSLKSLVENAPIVGGAASTLNRGSALALRPLGKSTVLDLFQTRKVWQESQMPKFSLELTFWGLKAGENRPIDIVNSIYSGLFPTRDGLLANSPLNYRFTKNTNNEASGTVSLTVGKWLRIRSRLVILSANFTPSLEVMSDGSPLYMTGSVELEPYRMITYEEYLTWFPVTTARPPHSQTTDTSNKAPNLNNQIDEINNPLGRTEIV